jgi:hypothetical protein
VLGINGWLHIANSRVAPTSKAEMQANNMIFYQLLKATIDSQIYGMIKQFSPKIGADGQYTLADGRLAWQALVAEFNSTDNIAAMKHSVEAELLALRCTDKDSIVQYICDFNNLYTELIELGHVFDPDTLYHHFTDRIITKKYDLDLQWGARRGWSLHELQTALRNASIDDERKRASLHAYTLRAAHATPKANSSSGNGPRQSSTKKDPEKASAKPVAANTSSTTPKTTTVDSNGDVTYPNGFRLTKKDSVEMSKAQRIKIKKAPDKNTAMEIWKKWRNRTQESSNSKPNSSNSSSPTVSETTSTPAAPASSTSAVPNWQQRRFHVHFAKDVKAANNSSTPPIPVQSLQEPKTMGGGPTIFDTFSRQ